MTPANLQTLSAELKSPAYTSLNDSDAADVLAVVNRPADGSVSAMLSYLLVNKNKSGTGSDTNTTSMLGRLIMVSNATVGTDPFGSTVNVTLDMKCSALALLEVVRNPKISALPYQTATLQQLLTDAIAANVMKAADRTALIALSNNLQSRWAELGLPGSPNPSDVASARKLP